VLLLAEVRGRMEGFGRRAPMGWRVRRSSLLYFRQGNWLLAGEPASSPAIKAQCGQRASHDYR